MQCNIRFRYFQFKQNCQKLQQDLADEKGKNQILEQEIAKLSNDIQLLTKDQTLNKKQISGLQAELKQKTIQSLAAGLSSLSQSADSKANEGFSSDQMGATPNASKLQQDLRVSKKAEELAKNKLAETKQMLQKSDEKLAKLKEDSEQRIQTLKNEITILQKHYDQLQTSINESELERSQRDNNSSGGDRGSAELLKIIEEYSKQTEQKSKDIDILNSKMDKKQDKIRDLKKAKKENELKITKLKSTLDNVKTFLKLLNTNFMKGIRQQNMSLKDQFMQSERDFVKELENAKASLTSQINKIVIRKEKEFSDTIQDQKEKNINLQQKLSKMTQDFEQKLKEQKTDFEETLTKQNQSSQKKIQSLKDKIKSLSDHQQTEGDQKSAVKDQLNQKIQIQEKQIDLLQLQLISEKDKFNIQITELQKDIQFKMTQISEFKEKESELLQKLEDQEIRQRQELQKIIEKYENDKLVLIQRESQVNGAREAERLKEIKQIYETKIQDKDTELERLRAILSGQENLTLKTKDELYNKVEQLQSLNRESEREIQELKNNKQKSEKKINSVKEKLTKQKTKNQESENLISQLKDEKSQTQKQFELIQQEQNKALKQIQQQKSKIQEFEEHIKQLNSKVEFLENQLDATKFDLNDEIREKDEEIVSFKSKISEQKDKIQKLEDQLIQQQSFAKQQQIIIEENEKYKRKYLQKQPKTEFKEIQTETLQENEFEIQTIIVEFQIISDVQKADKSAEPPKQQSPTIRGQHNEEDQFVAESVEESVEKRIQQREPDEMDMAMRQPGPGFQGGFRPPAPRQTTPLNPGRGRGGAPSGMRPPMGQQFRPPTQQFNQVSSQQQPINQEVNIENQNKQIQEERKTQLFIEEPNQIQQQPMITPTFQQIPQFEDKKIETKKEERNLNMSLQQSPFKNNAQEENKEIQNKESLKKDSIPTVNQTKQLEEEKKSDPIRTQQQQQAQTLLDFRNNRFFGMINGFITFLTKNRQAYTGKPASAIVWNDKKQRYIIDGVDDSDDDIPPPPPPSKKKEEIKHEASGQNIDNLNKNMQEASSSNDLTKPALPSFMTNRGRGRGRGGSNITQNRFPQTFGQGQIQETKFEPPKDDVNQQIPQSEPIQQINQQLIQQNQETQQEDRTPNNREEVSELYTTSLDITMNQTMLVTSRESQKQRKAEQIEFDQARESQWLDKFSSQQEKINNLKYKMSMLQQELRIQREENESNIENFTLLCQDLKFKGIDEVEDLQSEIQILREQLKSMAQDKAVFEVKTFQMTDSLRHYEEDNNELREKLREQKFLNVQAEIEKELLKISKNSTIQAQGEQEENEKLDMEKQILDLQIENDQLKWKQSMSQAEKLQKTLDNRDLASLVDKQINQLQALESENFKIKDEIRKVQQDFQIQSQELVSKLEKEKDSIREILLKTQSEKDRIQDQNRERVNEYETRIKKLESEKSKLDQDVSKLLRDKDVSIDQLKNQVIGLNQAIQQKNQEISWQNEQNVQQQQKIQQLMHKRQNESEQTENMIKVQVKQIQDMLMQKTALLEQHESKAEETNQELQEMNMIRHKLTENIIYLQNEIRKRDELLESSEFGDFDMIGDESDSIIAAEDESVRGQDLQSNKGDDDMNAGQSLKQSQFVHIQRKKRTFGQQIQNQLDEARLQLKAQIEEKMRVQRKFQILARNYEKITEGITDISQILDQQQQTCGIDSRITDNLEQSSSLFQEEESKTSTQMENQNLSSSKDDSILLNQPSDEMIHQVISKIFSISRHYESEISEIKHKLKMMTMKAEESENLKFDIEMLNEEKQMIESDASQLKQQLRDFDKQLSQSKIQFQEQSNQSKDLRNQLNTLQEDHDRQIQKLNQGNELIINNLRSEHAQALEQIQEQFKTQIMPEIKKKHEKKQKELVEQFQKMKEHMQQQIDEQKLLNQQLDQSSKSMLNQSQIQVEEEREEKDRLKDRISMLEIQKQEFENQNNSLKQQYESEVAYLTEQARSLQKELDDSTLNFTQYKEQLEQGFKEAALKLKHKNDDKKRIIKEMQQKVKEQVQILISNQQKEVVGIKTKFDEEVKKIQEQENAKREELLREITKLQTELVESLIKGNKQDSPRKEQEQDEQKEEQIINPSVQSTEQIQQLQSEIEQHKVNLSQSNQKVEEYLFEIQQLKTQIKELKEELQEAKSQEQKEQEGEKIEDSQLEEQIKNLQEIIKELKEQHQIKVDQMERIIQQSETNKINEIENLQQITRQVKLQLQEQNQKLQDEIKKLKDLRSSSNQDNDNDVQESKQQERTQQQIENSELNQFENQLVKVKLQNKILLDSITDLTKSKEEETSSLQSQISELQAKEQVNLSNIQTLEQQLANIQEKSSSQQDIDILKQELQANYDTQLQQKDQDFAQERQDMIQHYSTRELEFQTMAEQMALKLKGAIKKEKERVKVLQETVKDLQAQIVNIEKERDGLLSQIEEFKASELQRQEQEDKSLINEELQNQVNKLKQEISVMGQNIQEKQQLFEDLQKKNQNFHVQIQIMISEIIQVLQTIDINFETEDWSIILDKLKETLQNYAEDKRSLHTLMEEKDELVKLNEQFQFEKEQAEAEKSVIVEKFENSNVNKLQTKVKLLEEERSEMKSDFYIKINSFVEEIDTLKNKLSHYESVIQEDDRENEHKGNQTLINEMKNSQRREEAQPSFMDQSKTSNIQGQPKDEQQDLNQTNPNVQKSGLFTSIASFFLTDSELHDN